MQSARILVISLVIPLIVGAALAQTRQSHRNQTDAATQAQSKQALDGRMMNLCGAMADAPQRMHGKITSDEQRNAPGRAIMPQFGMMEHMMERMQMGKGSISQCPTAKGMRENPHQHSTPRG